MAYNKISGSVYDDTVCGRVDKQAEALLRSLEGFAGHALFRHILEKDQYPAIGSDEEWQKVKLPLAVASSDDGRLRGFDDLRGPSQGLVQRSEHILGNVGEWSELLECVWIARELNGRGDIAPEPYVVPQCPVDCDTTKVRPQNHHPERRAIEQRTNERG
ncbi:MAG: hypothetical protein QM784_32705 [Polyangiaceae bacterium]